MIMNEALNMHEKTSVTKSYQKSACFSYMFESFKIAKIILAPSAERAKAGPEQDP
jgi:hypothetical protein